MEKTIVNVSVIEATTNNALLKEIINNLNSVENTAFKVAVKCAYLLGVSIPCGSGTITNKNPLKAKDLYSKVNKSKATLSRWIKAVKLIIENGYFDNFNNGDYPFSFDKIIMILTNDNFDLSDETYNNFSDYMKMSVVELEKIAKGEEEDGEEEEEDGEEEDGEEVDNSPLVTFVYDDKTFSVHENALLKFIENSCTLA